MFIALMLYSGAVLLSTQVESEVRPRPEALICEAEPTAQTGDARSRRFPSEDIARIYDELQSQPLEARVRMFVQLPDSTKSAVWARHLEALLAAHPELTDAQRAVVEDALALMTPQFFALDASSPQWSRLVDEPLRRIEARAKAVFGVGTARELFTTLGPELFAPDSRIEKPVMSTAKREMAPLDVVPVPTCFCSTDSDYCDVSGLGIQYCAQGSCWSSMTGCGTFLRYACNGTCARTPL